LKRFIKYISGKTVQPLVKKYLSKQRVYRYKGIRLQIPPQVFHPAFFFSTKFLLRYINALDVTNKNFLELGAGSGLIGFTAAKRGAIVTATDINQTAIAFLRRNKRNNKIPVKVIASNLLDNIPQQVFDIIAINPPYYKKNPASEADYAWYCGENGDYFITLFKNIGDYINSNSTVLMTLCDGCDIELIKNIALQAGFGMTTVQAKNNLVEMNYIFKIEKAAVNV